MRTCGRWEWELGTSSMSIDSGDVHVSMKSHLFACSSREGDFRTDSSRSSFRFCTAQMNHHPSSGVRHVAFCHWSTVCVKSNFLFREIRLAVDEWFPETNQRKNIAVSVNYLTSIASALMERVHLQFTDFRGRIKISTRFKHTQSVTRNFSTCWFR